MGEIIIFKGIEEKALNAQLESLVLFGEKGFITSGEDTYDLVFHAKQTEPYAVEKVTSLVLPVLRVWPFTQERLIEKVYDAYLEHPDFANFAVAANSLYFCQVIPKDEGKEIRISGGYKRILEERFLDFAKNPKIAREIMEKRRLIDHKY